MSTQEQAQEYCFNILNYLYDQRQEDPTSQLSVAIIAEALNYDEPSTEIIVEDLVDSDLIEAEQESKEVYLTALGLDVVSRYRKHSSGATSPVVSQPASEDVRDENATTVWPDQVDILLPETHSVVKVTFPAVADALREAMPGLGLDDEQSAELEADIQTVSTQLSSPKPKTQVLLQCYRAIEINLNHVTDKDKVEELIRSVKSLMA